MIGGNYFLREAKADDPVGQDPDRGRAGSGQSCSRVLVNGGLTDGTIIVTSDGFHAEFAERQTEPAEKIFGPAADRSFVPQCYNSGPCRSGESVSWPKSLKKFSLRSCVLD